MAIYETTVLKGSRWARFNPVGSRIRINRTHPTYIHPTKGYRVASVPAGTNRRRRLIRVMATTFTGTRAWNLRLLTQAGGVGLQKALRAFRVYVKRSQQAPIPGNHGPRAGSTIPAL